MSLLGFKSLCERFEVLIEGKMHIAAVSPSETSVCLYFNVLTYTSSPANITVSWTLQPYYSYVVETETDLSDKPTSAIFKVLFQTKANNDLSDKRAFWRYRKQAYWCLEEPLQSYQHKFSYKEHNLLKNYFNIV